MKIEEAIEKLSNEKDAAIKISDVFGVPSFIFQVEHYNIAIAALEKQIAKKPIPLVTIDGEIDFCNECESDLSPDDEYCHECGTKIDWGNE